MENIKYGKMDKISREIKENANNFVSKDIRVKLKLMETLKKPLIHGKGKRKRKRKK